jgi:hypothetical protein
MTSPATEGTICTELRITAAGHGCPRFLAMRPGIVPSATKTATSVPTSTTSTIQAKMSMTFIVPSTASLTS